MDRLTSMRVFERIAALRSFSGAARELGISQATASKHIQTLEEWLGKRLFNRTTRRVDLTEFGASFNTRCARILEDVDDARSGPAPRAVTGLIRVASPVCFGSVVLGELLSGFGRDHPQVSFEVLLVDRVVDPAEEGFDIAFRMGNEQPPPAALRSYAAVRLTVCASPGYLSRAETVRRPSDLLRQSCLTEPTIVGPRWRFANGDGEDVVAVSGRMTANNLLVLRDSALADGGIICAPDFLVAEDVRLGRLVRLLESFAPVPIPLSAAIAPARQSSIKMRALLAYVGEALAMPSTAAEHPPL